MRRGLRLGTILGAALVLIYVYGPAQEPAAAQSALVAGGLTALPGERFGPNLLQNPSFETLSSGLPVGWTAGAGWSADQLVVRAGTVSYRRTTGSPTSSQTVQLSPGTYLVSAWVKTEALGNGTTSGVRLQLDFRVGGINAWTSSDVISGTNDWHFVQIGPVVVETDRRAAVKLENYNGPAGTAWFDDVTLVQVLPQPVDVFLLYPNYRGMLFDDQPQTIRLDVGVTPPGGDFGRHSVRAGLTDEASGQTIAQRSYASAARLEATLDGSAMQPGRSYLATVSLIDLATNAVVGSYPAYRVSKVPASARQAMNVSFDAKNRVLLRGVPRFVLGVYDSGLGYSTDPAFWEQKLWSPTGDRRMSGLPINMYLNYWYGQAGSDAMAALMNNLRQHGVMYLQTGNCFDQTPADAAFQINASDAYVAAIGAHAGSAGYYTIDECRPALQPGAFAQYDRLRRLDPDSVTFAALFADPQIALWRDSADVLASDPYPLFGAEPAAGYNLAQVGDWTARTRAAVKGARPIMTVLQFFKFTSLGRFPTFAEMRNMAYMAVVEGAAGLWWWSLGTNALQNVCTGWCPEKTAHMDNLKAVVSELAALEPVLLADDAPAALTGNSNGAAIRTKVKVVDGRGYLFAYNYTNAPQTATFTWGADAGRITVHAENRTLAAAGRTFTDTFDRYQAHVYVIDAAVPAPAPAPPPPPAPPTLTLRYEGTLRDRVGQGNAALAADGAPDGTVTVMLGGGARTITALRLESTGPGVWDTDGTNGFWALGVASSLDGALLNHPSTMGVSVPVADGSSIVLFASDYNGIEFLPGATLTVRAAFSDGTSAVATTVVPAPAASTATLAVTYNGQLRDRVGQGNRALAADGALDGTLTVTLGGGPRTITALRLESTGPGVWDTDGGNGYWAVGVATALDGPLLNNPATMGVALPVADNGSFVLFASDYNGIEFLPGATLTVRATFSDGTVATASTMVASASGPALDVSYLGKVRDRVGQGNTALAADGALDGTLSVVLRAPGARTLTGVRLESTAPGVWDTDGASGYWVAGVAVTLDGPLLNHPATTAVNLPVADGGGFVVFASDYGGIEFLPGESLTLTATFSDGTSAQRVVRLP